MTGNCQALGGQMWKRWGLSLVEKNVIIAYLCYIMEANLFLKKCCCTKLLLRSWSRNFCFSSFPEIMIPGNKDQEKYFTPLFASFLTVVEQFKHPLSINVQACKILRIWEPRCIHLPVVIYHQTFQPSEVKLSHIGSVALIKIRMAQICSRWDSVKLPSTTQHHIFWKNFHF